MLSNEHMVIKNLTRTQMPISDNSQEKQTAITE